MVIAAARHVVMTLKMVIEGLPIRQPKIIQRKQPSVNAAWAVSEIADVSRERMIFTACGSQQKVVSEPAAKPMLSTAKDEDSHGLDITSILARASHALCPTRALGRRLNIDAKNNMISLSWPPELRIRVNAPLPVAPSLRWGKH
jgi:hypothetical protein